MEILQSVNSFTKVVISKENKLSFHLILHLLNCLMLNAYNVFNSLYFYKVKYDCFVFLGKL